MRILRSRPSDPIEPSSTSYAHGRGAYGSGMPDDPPPTEQPPTQDQLRRQQGTKSGDNTQSMAVRPGENLANVADQWRLRQHQPVDGRCPECGTRGRCWTYAMAFGNLVARGRLI